MSDAMSSLFDKVGGTKRVMILGLGVAAAGLIFAVAQWAGAPTWVPAYVGVPLEAVTQLTDKLDQAAVKYRLERGGSDIMVAQTDLAKARVALAKGGNPMAGRPGLELFDQPSWGMTDFTQRINYRRALEGELERTIGKMRGIEAAQVHLVLHETDGFAAAERPTEASVVLKLRGEPDLEVVKGISHLVASSVEGLTSEHVTILNDAGRMLSEAIEAIVDYWVVEPPAADAARDRGLHPQQSRTHHRAAARPGEHAGPGVGGDELRSIAAHHRDGRSGQTGRLLRTEEPDPAGQHGRRGTEYHRRRRMRILAAPSSSSPHRGDQTPDGRRARRGSSAAGGQQGRAGAAPARGARPDPDARPQRRRL